MRPYLPAYCFIIYQLSSRLIPISGVPVILNDLSDVDAFFFAAFAASLIALKTFFGSVKNQIHNLCSIRFSKSFAETSSISLKSLLKIRKISSVVSRLIFALMN